MLMIVTRRRADREGPNGWAGSQERPHRVTSVSGLDSRRDTASGEHSAADTA